MSSQNAKTVSLVQPRHVALTRDALLVFGFTLATALAAQVKIPLPFTPVPITAQTLMVVLAGLTLGTARGAASQALYLALGFAGAPFFAEVSGGAATLGYLVGFVPSAALAGVLARRIGTRSRRLSALSLLWLAAFAASLPTLALGTAWLKYFLAVDWTQAVAMGFTPFLVGDLYKTTLAAGIAAGVQGLKKS